MTDSEKLALIVERIQKTVAQEEVDLVEFARENPGMSGRNVAAEIRASIDTMKGFLDGIV